jgi:SAM-dependent methyltransferase
MAGSDRTHHVGHVAEYRDAMSFVWDETLFQGSATYYERGRIPYSPQLAEFFASALPTDGHGRLLDVGAGPGSVALLIAHLFSEVVALDADAEMVTEGERLAAARNIRNVRFVRARAEELPMGLGRFRVAVFAQSLHWMERERVFSTVGSMLEPGGAVVHVDRVGSDVRPPEPARSSIHPAPPHDDIQALVRSYLGEERRAGRSVITSTPGDEDEIFRAVGFVGPEDVLVPYDEFLERMVDDVVAEVLSMSSSAPHLFGARLDGFVDDLRGLLLSVSPSGRFSIRTRDNLLHIWRLSS